MAKSITFSFLLLFCLRSFCFSQDVKSGHFQHAAKDDVGNLISVDVAVKSYGSGSGLFWGAGLDRGRRPFLKTTISNVDMKINGKSVVVPFSCFSDLSNYTDFQINLKSKNYFTVDFFGGSGDYIYDALIEVENGMIVKRRVQSGLFQNQRWEETRYSWIEDNTN